MTLHRSNVAVLDGASCSRDPSTRSELVGANVVATDISKRLLDANVYNPTQNALLLVVEGVNTNQRCIDCRKLGFTSKVDVATAYVTAEIIEYETMTKIGVSSFIRQRCWAPCKRCFLSRYRQCAHSAQVITACPNKYLNGPRSEHPTRQRLTRRGCTGIVRKSPSAVQLAAPSSSVHRRMKCEGFAELILGTK